MREITLTQGQVAIVDDQDFERLNQHRWHAQRHHGCVYAQRSLPPVGGKQRMIKMHREILGTAPGVLTDHINGDGLDNQRANLRPCTNQENNRNRRSALGSTSRYLGVSWHKATGKWQAAIRINGHKRYLGLFAVEAEAESAYKAAAARIYGAFASGARGDRVEGL